MNGRSRAGVLLLSGSIVLLSAAAVALLLRGQKDPAPGSQSAAAPGAAQHVGGAVCGNCHQAEHDAHRGSHHDLAMQIADPDSVLGDFGEATFLYAGTTSTFARRGGRFYVETDGPDGAAAEYEIAYTFGVHPLQQYLVAFPGGRLQALSIAWDSRAAEQGGQRWFHLYPDETVTAGHPLHWTGLNQNWNYMCAECHSTNVAKAYDAEAAVYRTTFSELNVSCEACHGPGSAHVAWAEATAAGASVDDDSDKGLAIALDERSDVTWQRVAGTGNAVRSTPLESSREIDTCARCHGRASRISDNYVHGRAPLDTHRPALLDESIYWPDGQPRGEVYEWGSFVQSRMHGQGVTCSDCHEPHSLELRAPGNAVCTQCHSTDKYEGSTHTRHTPQTPAAACVSCHMPSTTYMQVDPRHDHSFRIPRPDLSVRLGVPNACNSCHTGESAAWAAAAIAGWTARFPKTDRQFAEALQAGSDGAPGARAALTALVDDPSQPALVRASALRRLGLWLSPATLPTVVAALQDREDIVRMAAVEGLAMTDPALKARQLAPLLDDATLAVRIEAAGALAGNAETHLSPAQRARFDAALEEHIAALRHNADRPEALFTLGNLFLSRGDPHAAINEYRGALTLDRSFAEAYVNLADVYRALRNERQAQATLREGLERSPSAAALHFALGLSLIRDERPSEAMHALEAAGRNAPAVPRYAYIRAVALHDWGEPEQASALLRDTLGRHPFDREVLTALAAYAAEAGDTDTAQEYVERLRELDPDSPAHRQLGAMIDGMNQKRLGASR